MKHKGKWPWKKGKLRALRNIPVFWVHQRTTNMDRSELIFHVTLNMLAAVIIFFLLFITHIFSAIWEIVLVALVLARTVSWILNDLFWGGIQVSFSSVKNCGIEQICRYLIHSAKRLSRCNAIYVCLIYGSIVRHEFHCKSDLDILYVRRPGFRNAVSALIFAAKERFIAFLTRIPLDLYVGDSEGSFARYRDDEIPIIVKDEIGTAAEKYENSVSLSKFLLNL